MTNKEAIGVIECLEKALEDNGIIALAPEIKEALELATLSLRIRTKGKWVYKNYLWTCDKCSNSFMWRANFCPNCGSKMLKD